MRPILLALLLMPTCIISAQTILPDRQLQLSAGTSTLYHRSGRPGMIFTTEYTRYFRPELSWAVGIGGTIHNDVVNVTYIDPSNLLPTDGSLRQTAAGAQVLSHIGYSLVRNKKYELQIRGGAFVRYQSSTLLREYSIIYNSPQPAYPRYVIVNEAKQKTMMTGGTIQAAFNYTFSNTISIGILGGLQQATNGDQVTQLSLTVGRRF